MDWQYFTLRGGDLYDESGTRCFAGQHKPFATAAEAEEWLEEQDERGTVR